MFILAVKSERKPPGRFKVNTGDFPSFSDTIFFHSATYIDQAGKLEELTDRLYEGLTGISFDGMYSSFIDNLMNMKYGAKDAAAVSYTHLFGRCKQWQSENRYTDPYAQCRPQQEGQDLSLIHI